MIPRYIRDVNLSYALYIRSFTKCFFIHFVPAVSLDFTRALKPVAEKGDSCQFECLLFFFFFELGKCNVLFPLLCKQCDPGVGVDRFFHALYTQRESRMVMLLGSACSEVTESIAKIVPYWNIVQVRIVLSVTIRYKSILDVSKDSRYESSGKKVFRGKLLIHGILVCHINDYVRR